VAGVDEAGRGALAGPVFAAAVMLPLESDALTHILFEVRDSKLLTPDKRETLYAVICDCVPAFAIGSATAEWIDRHGILPATRAAMTEAVTGLFPPAQAVLVDGPLRLVSSNLPQRPIVRGDRQSLSIAAASILAKVSRDHYMIQLSERYPEYGFSRHKGYGTAEHLAALDRLGPCPEHRRSFAPLRASLF
jgi:ribonuclease HII